MKKTLPTFMKYWMVNMIVLLLAVSGINKVFGQTSCQAAFNYSLNTTVSPNTITTTDNSFITGGTIVSYQWNYNGTLVSIAPNPTFSVPGGVIQQFDTLCLTITTDSGCISSQCTAVFGPCSLSVAFTFTNDSLGNYQFIPYTPGFSPPLSYLWTVDSGVISDTSQFFNVNLPVGQHMVCLTLTDAFCSLTYCAVITSTYNAACDSCTPHIYYVQDSISPFLFTFYDTTTYLNTPTSDSWTINGVNSGAGSVLTTTLSSSSSVIAICRNVTLTGCPGVCPSSACVYISPNQLPGIDVLFFSTSNSRVYCTTPDSVNFYYYGNLTGYSSGDTAHITINFDDGSDTTFDHTVMTGYFYGSLLHVYHNPGTYIPQIMVFTPDYLASDTMLLSDSVSSGAPILISNTCGALSGTVYLDNNANCIYDAGDSTLAYRWVTVTDGVHSWYTSSDSNGVYSFNVPVGPTYTVTVHTSTSNWYSGHYQIICPAGGSLTVTAVPSSGNNFYFGCPQGFDLDAYVSGWGFVPGRTAHICVYPFDRRCAAPNGQVILILDTLVTPLPDTSGNYTIQGDSVIWNITPGGAYNSYYNSLCVSVVTSTSATIGDSVCITVIVTPIAGDSVPSNNTQTKCWAVRTSYDPNDKAATPEGEGVTHAIRPGTELTYTIRFQNTGNAEAQDIYILDQLDANLDPGTLEVLAASHSMIPTLLTGNIIRFDFPNINLPDSNENEALSHGYVNYRISPWSSVANGTIINNSADIYFDYNPAVLTNIVFHTIDFTIGLNHVPGVVNSTLFPNPADGEVFVLLPKPGKTEIKLFDITGKLVMNRTIVNSGMLDIQSLPAGAYKVQMIREDSIQNSSLIIAR